MCKTIPNREAEGALWSTEKVCAGLKDQNTLLSRKALDAQISGVKGVGVDE